MLPVYLINLDRSPERLAFMCAQATALGFSFIRIPGVDGRAGLPDWLKDKFPSNRMTSGEVGCYASHLEVFRTMLAEGHSAAIVLEDDAVLDLDFHTVGRRAIAASPIGWDVIHLQTKFKNSWHPLAKLGWGYELIRHARLPAGSTAYAISAAGCRKLLSLNAHVRPFDMEFRYAWVGGLDLYGVHPPPAAGHRRFASTIGAIGQLELLKRRRGYWAPGVISNIWGKIVIKRNLGLVGTISCWRQEFQRPRPSRIGSPAVRLVDL